MGETYSGLEGGQVVQTVNKIWKKRSLVGLLFFLLFVLILILPIRHEHTGGSYVQLFGGTAFKEISDKYTSGFQEIYVALLNVFYFVSVTLFILAKNRIVIIFSVITSFLNLLSLPVIYFMLTFHLQFFGPPKTISVSYGFYAMIVVDILLVIFTFILLRKVPKESVHKNADELLDF